MEKIEQKNFLLEVAEQQGDVIYKDNKTFAKFSWLRQWEKNPRIIQEKNLKKLKNQIEELGLYKPLVVYLEKNNAVILGGNMRYKAIKELKQTDKTGKYDYVWVSLVNADNDVDKLKYALSDNFTAGEYTREQLKEVINIEQVSMFDGYDLDIGQRQTINEFVDSLALSDNEIKFKHIKKELQKMGINDETVGALEMMTSFSKINEDLPDVDLCGTIVGKKFGLLFWVDDELVFEQLKQIYSTGYKDKYNVDLLKEVTEKQVGVKLPTENEKLANIIKELRGLQDEISFRNEIKQNAEKQNKIRQDLIDEFNKLINYEQII